LHEDHNDKLHELEYELQVNWWYYN